VKILFTTLVFLIALTSFSSNNEKVIIINDELGTLNLDEYTYHFSTKDSSLNIEQVLDNKFNYFPGGLNVGVNDKIHWAKYNIENPTDEVKEYYIYFPYIIINKIDAFSIYNNTISHLKSTGAFYTNQKEEIVDRGYPILLKLKPGSTTIVIKIEHLYLPLKGISFLLKENDLRRSIKKSEGAIWFWRGVFLSALLITFVLFITIRAKSFLYYFLFNVGVLLFFGAEIGDFIFFEPNTLNEMLNIKFLGNTIILIFFPLFINEITPIAQLRPKLWKIMFAVIFFLPVLLIICIIPAVKNSYMMFYTTYFYLAVSSLVFLLQLYFLFYAFINRVRNALIVLIAYSFYALAIFINVILPNLGIIENSLEIYNSFIYGSIFEIVIFMGLLGKETLSVYDKHSVLLEKQKEHQVEIIKAIVESQEKERNKVGRELHDMIGANISVIKQQSDKSNTSLISVIEKTIELVRNLSHGLVTPLIKDDEFVDEINELCILFSDSNIEIQSNFHNWTKIEDAKKATHLYRIVQELLQNAVKHSLAQDVLIQFIINREGELTLMYEDDGNGFDYKHAYQNKGLGLINIENRVKLIDATIIYDTMKNRKGTTVIINVPI